MRTIFTIFLLVYSTLAMSQQGEKFDEFLKLFPSKKIDSTSQVNFLKRQYFPQHESVRAVRIKRKTDNYTAAIIQIECKAGGMCESQYLYTFSKKGNLIEKYQIQKHMADCSFTNRKTTVFFDSIFYTTTIKEEADCSEDSLISRRILINENILTPDGQIKKSHEDEIAESRKYEFVSFEKLSSKDLKSYSKNQLAEMRNELFASYGYKFKTPKWQEYFNQFDWYNPEKEEIAKEELNLIEQLNLELIMLEEKSRN